MRNDPVLLLSQAFTAPPNPREIHAVQAATRELDYLAYQAAPPPIGSGLTPRFLASLAMGGSLAASREAHGALVAIRLHDRGDLVDAAEEPELTLTATTTRRVTTALADLWDVTLTSDGPDLLAVLLPRDPNPDLAATLTSLSEQLAAPIPVPGWLIELEASIGVTPLDPVSTPAQLIAQARRGLPDRVHLRRTPIDELPPNPGKPSPLTLLPNAWDAADDGRLNVSYQVISQTDSPGIVGVQAVPGWVDDDGVHRSLAGLGDLASVTGLAHVMIENTVADTCTALASWAAQLRATTPFAHVSLPAPLVRSQRFCSRLHDLIDNSGIASLLLLGVPAAALNQIPDIDKRLAQLTNSGAQLALSLRAVDDTPADALTRAAWSLVTLSKPAFELLRNRNYDTASHTALKLLLHAARKLDIPVLAEETDLADTRIILGTAMFTPTSRLPPQDAHQIADEPTWTAQPSAQLLAVTDAASHRSALDHLPQPRDTTGAGHTRRGW
ncbi:EAL domain-containing protein [Amycolatopsis sp. NPDC052450]|uniref:EAL domain-containing protein n=1 Tax=Amycolatopsis sp. NPDC052450 TaxID=3363937 RepID=UPI0037CB9B50